MIDAGTIKRLAELSRIELSPAESEKIQKDVGSILDYVSELKNAPVGGIVNDKEHINIMREDSDPHESGGYTDKILAEAPKQNGGYFVVKQIMEEKKRITN
ncbi:MAG TPA: Asp-tRNA(Asn)/Glu-tRNA(Gln) amidotransferase subunit GatC [Candidatus Paceibacterota bacterium]|nr:Asp-tRNA(Asn)/Glu-tRNA(Gln) amidotransferase subunit GatC [Candidatus Paceibacterota bacterium]